MTADHKCPASGCIARVPNRLLACVPHWNALSKPTQDAIYATARKNLLDPARRAALADAREEWKTQP